MSVWVFTQLQYRGGVGTQLQYRGVGLHNYPMGVGGVTQLQYRGVFTQLQYRGCIYTVIMGGWGGYTVTVGGGGGC